jgi:hypothetical protein
MGVQLGHLKTLEETAMFAINGNLDRGFTWVGWKRLTITKQVIFGEWLA